MRVLRVLMVLVLVVIGSTLEPLLRGHASAAGLSYGVSAYTPTTYRDLCDGSDTVDFAVKITPTSVNVTSDGTTVSAQLDLKWKDCGTTANAKSYAIYNSDFCPLSGYYAASPPGESHQGGPAYDCVKYVGSTADSEKKALGCEPGHEWGNQDINGNTANPDPSPWRHYSCTTPNYDSYVKKTAEYPTTTLSTSTIPVVIGEGRTTDGNIKPYRGLTSSTMSSGSHSFSTDNFCEYFVKSTNGMQYSGHRCVNVSITITWNYIPPPSSTCTTTLSNSQLAPGQRARINYTITTQNVVEYIGTPSGSITGSSATGGSIAQNGLTASGANLTGSATYTAPSTPGTYTIHSGTFASSPGTYNSNCSPSSFSVTVSYMPYFKVNGGDIAAGTGFGNSCTTQTGKKIESWNNSGTHGLDPTATNDYQGAGTTTAAFATGAITNFVSGMGLSGAPNGGSFGTGAALSFANTTPPASVNTTDAHGGNFGTLPCVQNFYGTNHAGATSVGDGTVNVSSLGTGSYSASSGITLSSATIPTSTTITLYVQGNVYINGDIKYAAYTLNTVPRFNLYVQGNIYIAPTVHELHGVYIAQKNGGTGGNIVTCTDITGTASESYNDCNSQLNIVGAVAAQGNISMTRTYGSLDGSGATPFAPAETFTYSPELWLGGGGTSLQPQSYTSLPPVL